MLIGILQTGQAPADLISETGDYPDMFQTLLAAEGFEFRTWRVLDMEFPASVTECDGWLITGSRFGAYEDHAFIPVLEDFIRKSWEAHVPMVGICFGHQIIAQAMGGRVEKFAGGWSVGPTDYDFAGEKIRLNAWHQDQVVEKPDTACVVASSGFCDNAALIYGDRIFTVQAHPEFGNDFVEGLMRTRGKGVVPDALLDAAAARLELPLDDQILAHRIGAFFRAPRAAGSQSAA